LEVRGLLIANNAKQKDDQVPLPLRERLGEGYQVIDENAATIAPREMKERARQLRHTATLIESALWERLRNRRCDGFKFRRQTAVGPFVADFVCYEAMVIVELDGESHNSSIDYDLNRTAWFERQGFIIVRFMNAEVRNNLEGVWEAIRKQCIDRKDPLT
jgi:very-short-patch-repair endonuclease